MTASGILALVNATLITLQRRVPSKSGKRTDRRQLHAHERLTEAYDHKISDRNLHRLRLMEKDIRDRAREADKYCGDQNAPEPDRPERHMISLSDTFLLPCPVVLRHKRV